MVKILKWQQHQLVIRMVKIHMSISEIFYVQHELTLKMLVFKELCNMDDTRLSDCLRISLSEEDHMFGKNIGILGYDIQLERKGPINHINTKLGCISHYVLLTWSYTTPFQVLR